MLLSANTAHNTFQDTESLVIQLMLQRRYAQAYELLIGQQSPQAAALYNMAVCLHWGGNYQEALSRLESIQLAPQMGNANKIQTDSNLKAMQIRQNQADDHLYGISEAYMKSFPALASDAIIRLKADCLLQLGDYARVIAVASPIAHKGYLNITNALQSAHAAHDNSI